MNTYFPDDCFHHIILMSTVLMVEFPIDRFYKEVSNGDFEQHPAIFLGWRPTRNIFDCQHCRIIKQVFKLIYIPTILPQRHKLINCHHLGSINVLTRDWEKGGKIRDPRLSPHQYIFLRPHQSTCPFGKDDPSTFKFQPTIKLSLKSLYELVLLASNRQQILG